MYRGILRTTQNTETFKVWKSSTYTNYPCQHYPGETTRSKAEAAPRAPENFLEQEVARLNEVHKKDELIWIKTETKCTVRYQYPGKSNYEIVMRQLSPQGASISNKTKPVPLQSVRGITYAVRRENTQIIKIKQSVTQAGERINTYTVTLHCKTHHPPPQPKNKMWNIWHL